MQQSGSGSETEVTWEDQQNINKFGRLNNRYHELEDEIKISKDFNLSVLAAYSSPSSSPQIVKVNMLTSKEADRELFPNEDRLLGTNSLRGA